ncbi:hypothetical protein CCACVL1_08140 [Corchorus capsularis]|uniref:RNase H type-1 domain-containing protein n=1 Tax=Corchorus capsularis TaxID=210143 RepID=A0A1R3J279_COCAP|nr:hypothetical protein CCACVL1_08140 [Corchorus capsularis]
MTKEKASSEKESTLKLDHTKDNCDGSFDPKNGSAGVGIVVRNGEGKLVNGSGLRIEAASALEAEAKALLEAGRLAQASGGTNAIFETDSEELFYALATVKRRRGENRACIVGCQKPFAKSGRG